MTPGIPPFVPNAAPPVRSDQAATPSGSLPPFGDLLRSISTPRETEASDAGRPALNLPADGECPGTDVALYPELPSGFMQSSAAALATVSQAPLEGREPSPAAASSAGCGTGVGDELPAVRQLRAFSDIRLGADATHSAPSRIGGAAERVSQPLTASDPVTAAQGASSDTYRTGPTIPNMPQSEPTVTAPTWISGALKAPGSEDPVTGQPSSPPFKARTITPGTMPLVSSVHGRSGNAHSSSAGVPAAPRYPALPPLGRHEPSRASAAQVTVLPAGAGLDVRLRLSDLSAGGASRLRDEVSAILASHGLRIGTIAVFAPGLPHSMKEDT
jgi:hypothetical protein